MELELEWFSFRIKLVLQHEKELHSPILSNVVSLLLYFGLFMLGGTAIAVFHHLNSCLSIAVFDVIFLM